MNKNNLAMLTALAVGTTSTAWLDGTRDVARGWRHLSRETLNRPKDSGRNRILRDDRKARRKRAMRLRKLRGRQ